MASAELIDTINRIRSATGMHPILAAALQANTAIAVDGETERAAVKQAAGDKKTSILWKGDRVSVKNMPTEDFVGAAQESGSQKLNEVAAVIQPMIQPAPEEEARHQRLAAAGVHTPDPIDPTLADPNATKFRKGYTAARDLGDNPVAAGFKGIIASISPSVDPSSADSPLRRVETARSLNEAAIENKYLLPREEEDDRRRRLDDAEKTAGVRRLREIIGKTDMAGLPDDQARVATVADEYGVDPQQLPKWSLATIAQKTLTDVEKHRVARFKEFRTDRKALGEYPNSHAALVALGVPLNDEESQQFRADYYAAREETVRQRQNELYRARTESRSADAAERAADNASKGKAVDAGALFRGTLTPETLLLYRGKRAFDQDSVQAAIDAGIEHFSDGIQDRQEKMREIDEILASPPENMSEADRMRFAKLRGQKRLLLNANQRDQKALATLRQGGSETAAPAAGREQTDDAGDPQVPIVSGSRGNVVKVRGKLVYQPHN